MQRSDISSHTLSTLPTDAILKIASKLSINEYIALSKTNQHLFHLLSSRPALISFCSHHRIYIILPLSEKTNLIPYLQAYVYFMKAEKANKRLNDFNEEKKRVG